MAPAALAQGAAQIGPPAETPPASYAARAYVDSRGCSYVRAVIDGTVTWVPRVNRAREPLCGLPPTFAAAPAEAAPPSPPPAPEVPAAPSIAAAPPPPVAAPEAAAAAPAAAPAAVPPRRVARPAPPPPAPVATLRVEPVVVGAAQTPAPAPPPSGSQIIDRNGVITVLHGPKPIVPQGYRAAWSDDRLSRMRGKQTLTGALATALVWTQDVPRRLVDPTSGADMTERLSYLVYPYTDYDKQLADLRAGTHVMVRTLGGERRVIARAELAAQHAAPRVSTKSAPPHTGAARYIQVGSYPSEAAARSVLSQIQAQGLPARLAKYKSPGSPKRLVLIGPWPNAASAAETLWSLRKSGYPGARLR